MRYGLISDVHYGYHSGNRTDKDGVNIREQDHYDAAFAAVDALKAEGVDVILDLGDMAEVPAPKKRAVLNLINLVRFSKVPYYSVDGNHTSLKSSSDIHLYDILASECDNFRGFRRPAFDRYTGVSFVPHSYDNDEIRESIEEALTKGTKILVGHWAADDIPYVGQVARRDLPSGIPTFLGHYHNYRPSANHNPTYVGATEKTAWDQWDYPTGCAVFDSESGEYLRIDISTRRWVDVQAGPDDYLETLMSHRIRDSIARLTVTAAPEEYRLVDQVAAKAYARDAGVVNFTMRRKNVEEGASPGEYSPTSTLPLADQWVEYAGAADVPGKADRTRIIDRGVAALNG
jgi:DNA repair exonuclease SbcCD nuclease subunit